MTVTYLGELQIQATIPGVMAPLFAAYADAQAKVAAMVTFVAQLGLPPIPIVAQLTIAEGIVASLNAALTLGISPPDLSAQLSIGLAALAQVEAYLAVFTTLFGLIAAGGVFAYAYDGATNAFGAGMTTALATGFPGHGATDHANVLVLGTVDAATWAAMGGVFKTS